MRSQLPPYTPFCLSGNEYHPRLECASSGGIWPPQVSVHVIFKRAQNVTLSLFDINQIISLHDENHKWTNSVRQKSAFVPQQSLLVCLIVQQPALLTVSHCTATAVTDPGAAHFPSPCRTVGTRTLPLAETCTLWFAAIYCLRNLPEPQ